MKRPFSLPSAPAADLRMMENLCLGQICVWGKSAFGANLRLGQICVWGKSAFGGRPQKGDILKTRPRWSTLVIIHNIVFTHTLTHCGNNYFSWKVGARAISVDDFEDQTTSSCCTGSQRVAGS